MALNSRGDCCGCGKEERIVVRGLGTSFVEVAGLVRIELFLCDECAEFMRTTFADPLSKEDRTPAAKATVDHAARLADSNCSFCQRTPKEAYAVFRLFEVYRGGDEVLRVVRPNLDLIGVEEPVKLGEVCVCTVCVKSAPV